MKTNVSDRKFRVVYLAAQQTVTLNAGGNWLHVDFSAFVPADSFPLVHMTSAGHCGIRPHGDANDNSFATGGVGDWEHIAPAPLFEGYWDAAQPANYILIGYVL